MNITLNNTAIEVPEEASLQDLIELQNIAINGIAVAQNQLVVPKEQWAETMLQSSDEILIITATQGG